VAGAYLVAFLIGFFTLAVMAGELLIFRRPGGEIFGPRGREVYSVWINPYFAMVDAVDAPLSIRTDPFFSPYTPFETLLYNRQGVQANFLGGGMAMPLQGSFEVRGGPVFAPAAIQAVDNRQEVRLRRGSLWIRSAILYAVISALALIRAAALVRAPARATMRMKRLRHAPS
jgi:hypothetical protein